MKKLKVKVTNVIAILFVLIFFVLSCSGFELYKTANRSYASYPLSNELKERIRNDVLVMDDPCDVIRYSCSLTAELLSFSKTNDIPHGKANCIGYTQLSTSICNYAMKELSRLMEDRSLLKIKARPVVGYVKCVGINLNSLSQKVLSPKYRPFFKDHDFMEVDFGDETILVDAYLYDYFGSNDL